MELVTHILSPQSYEWSWWSLPPILVSVYFFALWLLIFSKARFSGSSFAFAIYSFSAMIWLLSYATCFSSASSDVALVWCWNAYAGISFIAVAMYHFTVEFTKRLSQRKWVLLSYVVMMLFLPLTRTPHFIGGLHHWFWGYYPYRAGWLYDVFLGSFMVFWLLGIRNLLATLRVETSDLKKKQLRMLCAAFFVGTTAFVDFAAKYDIGIYPFGYIPVTIFLTMIFYAITQYHLMGIETVVHRTILWALASLTIMVPVYLFWAFWTQSHTVYTALEMTLISFVLFVIYTLHSRYIQPRIDHLFRRRKYDYFQIFGQLIRDIGGELNIERISERLLTAFRETLYVRNAVVLVRSADESKGVALKEIAVYGYDAEKGELTRSRAAVLPEATPLFHWLEQSQDALESAQIEMAPPSEEARVSARDFFAAQQIEVLIPLLMAEKLIGAIGLGRRQDLRRYGSHDMILLGSIGRQMTAVISNALHHKDIVEKERLDEELKLGRAIQMALLPDTAPRASNLVVQGVMIPAREIGGDYFDFIEQPDKEGLSVVIGDVSGKGVAAGLLMAIAKTAISIYSREEDDPQEILRRTNSILHQHMLGENFMSMLYMRWNSRAQSLRYASAGHEHIIVCRRQGREKIEAIPSGGFVLGLTPDVTGMLAAGELSLNVGDKLVLYTDGVIEAMNSRREMFELENLVRIVEKYAAQDATTLMGSIKSEIFEFMAGASQHDDITIVVIEAV
jgi:serine phosphatase RsbU (regulator of sigma subunit)